MEVHAFDASPWKVEQEGLGVQSFQPQGKFEASLVYMSFTF